MNEALTLKPLLQEWLMNVKKKEVAHKTFQNLMCVARQSIYPRFGDYELSKITQNMIKDFVDGIGPLYRIALCKQVFNEFFNYCVKTKLIKEHPASSIVFAVAAKGRESKALDTEEQARLLNAVSKNYFWHPFCLLIMSAGIRLNELLALNWKDVNFEKKLISIDKYVKPKIRRSNKATPAFKVEKHHTPTAVRTIEVSDDIIKALKKFKLSREVRQLQVRSQYSFTGDNDLIFSNKYGKLFNYSSMIHIFHKYLKRQGYEDKSITFSLLRQTFFSEKRKSYQQSPLTEITRKLPDGDYAFEKNADDTPKRKAKQHNYEM